MRDQWMGAVMGERGQADEFVWNHEDRSVRLLLGGLGVLLTSLQQKDTYMYCSNRAPIVKPSLGLETR